MLQKFQLNGALLCVEIQLLGLEKKRKKVWLDREEMAL